MKTCKEFCDMFSDYIDGDVCESECDSIEEHLQDCPPCDLLFESFRRSINVCNQGISDEIPEAVRDRLRMFLRENCKKQ